MVLTELTEETEEIKDKKISNDHSPGGGQAGAVVMTLQQLEPYFGTQFFLVDLETGECSRTSESSGGDLDCTVPVNRL